MICRWSQLAGSSCIVCYVKLSLFSILKISTPEGSGGVQPGLNHSMVGPGLYHSMVGPGPTTGLEVDFNARLEKSVPRHNYELLVSQTVRSCFVLAYFDLLPKCVDGVVGWQQETG